MLGQKSDLKSRNGRYEGLNGRVIKERKSLSIRSFPFSVFDADFSTPLVLSTHRTVRNCFRGLALGSTVPCDLWSVWNQLHAADRYLKVNFYGCLLSSVRDRTPVNTSC